MVNALFNRLTTPFPERRTGHASLAQHAWLIGAPKAVVNQWLITAPTARASNAKGKAREWRSRDNGPTRKRKRPPSRLAGTDHQIPRRRQPVDVVRPCLQHLPPLLGVLGAVVDAAHAADGVVQRLFHNIRRLALLVQQGRCCAPQIMDGEGGDLLSLQ